jgi:DNA transposition AAA+ family ATPase
MNLEIKERLESSLERYGVSQAQAARDMGYSGAVLSAYRNGAYKGNVDALEEGIIRWIARQVQAHTHKKLPIVETDDLLKIVNAIQIAHTESDIALIIADAGAGKTTAVKYYAEQNARTTVLVEVVKGMNMRELTQRIAEQLGLETVRVALQTLVRNVSNALAERQMVVVLDEADYLKADALEFARRVVHDIGNSGLVLVGLPRLKYIIQNLKQDHRQLESRIGVYLPLAGLTKKDAALITKSVWADIDSKIIDAIYGASKTDVRQFTKIIERMQSTMALNKVDVPAIEIVELAASHVIRRAWK